MKHHDLSANTVKLDYNILLQVALIAWGGAKTGVERALHEIQSAPIYEPNKSLSLTAESLRNHAEQLALAVETVEALRGLKIREELIVINQPEVKAD
jgi:hypothetical protein